MSDERVRQIQRFGWKRSLPDPRDIVADASGIKILDEVDPRGDYMTPVYDQEPLGSCTANAVAAAFDAHLIVSGQQPFYPSRLAIYALERIYEGAPLSADTGAFGRDGFKALRRSGALPETGDWAYDLSPASNWQRDPRPDLRRRTDDVKLTAPYKVVPQQERAIRSVLSNRQTIAFGFAVFESFMTVGRDGKVPMPGQQERVIGGHEVLAVGYLRSEPGYVLCRNSWATGFGIGGYFLFPLAMMLDRSISDDLRTIYRPLRG